MSEQQLREAYKLMKAGQQREAAQRVRSILKEDRDNATAWWLMSNLLEDEEKQVRALERVLNINPDHKGARAKMAQLRPESASPADHPDAMSTQEMLNLDWSKLKDDPHPDKQKKKESSRDDHKVATYAMLGLGGFVVLVVAIVVLQVVLSSELIQGPGPETTVNNYFAAFGDFDFEQVAELTCADYRGEVATAQEEFNALSGGAEVEDLQFDFSGITTQLIDSNADSATVRIGGSFAMSMPGVDLTLDIEELSDFVGDDTDVALIREDGRWRICESSQ